MLIIFIKLRLNRRSLQIVDLQVRMAQLPGRTKLRPSWAMPMAIKTFHVLIQEQYQLLFSNRNGTASEGFSERPRFCFSLTEPMQDQTDYTTAEDFLQGKIAFLTVFL